MHLSNPKWWQPVLHEARGRLANKLTVDRPPDQRLIRGVSTECGVVIGVFQI